MINRWDFKYEGDRMLDILAIILGLSEVSFVVWLVVKNLYIKGDR